MKTPRMYRFIFRMLIITVAFAAAAECKTATRSRFDLNIGYFGGYESNIYHTFGDTGLTGNYVQTLSSQAVWRYPLASALTQKFSVGGELTDYPSHSNRNRTTIEVNTESSWRYSDRGSLTARLGLARRNKDLIDDAGTVALRTLKRWETELVVNNRLEFARGRIDFGVRWQHLNYDEETGQTSYDYGEFSVDFGVSYSLSQQLSVRGTIELGNRGYDERRTYTREFGAFVGRPFSIREFNEINPEILATLKFLGQNQLELLVGYSDRTDNFENFYGFEQRRLQAQLELHPARHHRTVLTAEFKDKNYDHYWNSSIGRTNRVFIDYVDLQIVHRYKVSNGLTVYGEIRSYDKRSNYTAYDYNDVTAGLGIDIRL